MIESRFNSATTVGSWKTFPTASPPTPRLGFNSATTVGSWKTLIADDAKPKRVPLQFGHDRGLVENFVMQDAK